MAQSMYDQEVVRPNERASQYAHRVCCQSYENCPAVHVVPHQHGNFRGPVGFTWRRHVLEQMLQNGVHSDAAMDDFWVMLEEVENDGAGGKPQFFTLMGTPEVFRGLGWEIITMCADDFARSGRFPAVIDNEVNVRRVTEANFPLFQAMMDGYGDALKEARLVNVTGEVAVMKHSVTAFCDTGEDGQLVLTWGASCIGLAHRDRLLDPMRIEPDMAVVGLCERGYRCNGGTFFTNLVRALYGEDAHALVRNPTARAFVAKLCAPSVSYARMVASLLGWHPDASISAPLARVYGIAHITGGGLWGKFREVLPEGVGADLYRMPDPPPVLLEAQLLSRGTPYELSDLDAYGTLHGGCGMILVCHLEDVQTIVRCGVAHGIRARPVGTTTRSPDQEVIISSRFCEGRRLSSNELAE